MNLYRGCDVGRYDLKVARIDGWVFEEKDIRLYRLDFDPRAENIFFRSRFNKANSTSGFSLI